MVRPKVSRVRATSQSVDPGPAPSPESHTEAPAISRQFARLEAQFETLKAQVRQAQQLSALGAVAPMIAHEVNNLLTPVLGYAEAAVTSDDPSLMKKALTVATKNVRILIRMSERLLSIGAARTSNRGAVTLREVADEAHASLCRDLSKDGIQFVNKIDPDLRVRADALQVQQVLFNLLLNAREAMLGAHNGLIRISARRDGNRTVLEVHNTGEPIPADLLPHVFDALRSSKPVERNGRARCGGLGLALCRDLIEENEGAIRVTSAAETGTTFVIDLPSDHQQSEH